MRRAKEAPGPSRLLHQKLGRTLTWPHFDAFIWPHLSLMFNPGDLAASGMCTNIASVPIRTIGTMGITCSGFVGSTSSSLVRDTQTVVACEVWPAVCQRSPHL